MDNSIEPSYSKTLTRSMGKNLFIDGVVGKALRITGIKKDSSAIYSGAKQNFPYIQGAISFWFRSEIKQFNGRRSLIKLVDPGRFYLNANKDGLIFSTKNGHRINTLTHG